MSNVLDYTVVTAEDTLDLIKFVNERISQGWQPFGGVACYSEDTFCGPRSRFAQALVNYETSKD